MRAFGSFDLEWASASKSFDAVLGTPETIDGGAGIDTLDTTAFTGNYVVNLATGLTNFAGESFINMENLISGIGNDILTGNGGNDTVFGGLGRDLDLDRDEAMYRSQLAFWLGRDEAERVRPDAIAPRAELVHLHGTREVIARRQASRPGHFMPATLLASQFETLEPLAADERGVSIDVDQDIDSIIETYLALSATRATEQEKK